MHTASRMWDTYVFILISTGIRCGSDSILVQDLFVSTHSHLLDVTYINCLFDETMLVDPECQVTRAEPVVIYLEMDWAVTAMELGPLSSVLHHDKEYSFVRSVSLIS